MLDSNRGPRACIVGANAQRAVGWGMTTVPEPGPAESLNDLARITVGSYDNVAVDDARLNSGDQRSAKEPHPDHRPPQPDP